MGVITLTSSSWCDYTDILYSSSCLPPKARSGERATLPATFHPLLDFFTGGYNCRVLLKPSKKGTLFYPQVHACSLLPSLQLCGCIAPRSPCSAECSPSPRRTMLLCRSAQCAWHRALTKPQVCKWCSCERFHQSLLLTSSVETSSNCCLVGQSVSAPAACINSEELSSRSSRNVKSHYHNKHWMAGCFSETVIWVSDGVISI